MKRDYPWSYLWPYVMLENIFSAEYKCKANADQVMFVPVGASPDCVVMICQNWVYIEKAIKVLWIGQF